jgi:hypothetical protein
MTADHARAQAQRPLLRLRGIKQAFGPVQALAGLDLDIPAGRVTALLAVLYLGRLVSTGPAADYDTATAVHWMTTGTAPVTAGNGTGALAPVPEKLS